MNETPEENKTLCHAPWTHLDINLTKDTVLPCCMYKKPTLGSTENIMKIWTGEELSQLRQTFLSGEGIKNENCEHCYLTEPFSYRRHLSHKIEFYLNSDIYDANDLQLPVSMNISIDNTCNLSCRTCSPSFSSKVAALYKKSPLFNNKVFYLETKKKDIDSFADSFENLHVVNLMGGEPLYSKNTIHLIRKIKEKAKNFKEITLVSNMMTRNIEIFEELKTIPNTEITISIDGDRDINNYVRAESDFDTIRDNIKFITENYPNIKLSINSTISALTIGYIPELIKALHQLAIDTGAKFEKVKVALR